MRGTRTTLRIPLYESDTNSARDAAGARQQIYHSSGYEWQGVCRRPHDQVDVYGLFNGEPTAAAPVITPDGGTFAGEPERHAFHHDFFGEHLLHAGWLGSNAGVDALHGTDHDQYRHDCSRDCERARVCPERGEQRYLHVFGPDPAGELYAWRWDLYRHAQQLLFPIRIPRRTSTTPPMDRHRQLPRTCIRGHSRSRHRRRSTRSPSTPTCRTVMSHCCLCDSGGRIVDQLRQRLLFGGGIDAEWQRREHGRHPVAVDQRRGP